MGLNLQFSCFIYLYYFNNLTFYNLKEFDLLIFQQFRKISAQLLYFVRSSAMNLVF